MTATPVVDTAPRPGTRRHARRRPPALVRGNAQWVTLRTILVIAGLLIATLPAVALPYVESRLWTLMIVYTVSLLGLGLLVGPARQLALGHAAFVGIGAYAAAVTVSRYGWPFPLGLIAAAVIGFLIGGLFGLPALRVRGQYLAMMSLGLIVAFPPVVQRFGWLTGGTGGPRPFRDAVPPKWLHLTGKWFNAWPHFVVTFYAAIVLIVLWNIMRGPTGRRIRAAAEHEEAAAAFGIPVGRTIVLTYGLAAAIGGVAGGLQAFALRAVTTDQFDVLTSLGLYAAIVFGGAELLSGAFIGGIVLAWTPYVCQRLRLHVNPNLVYAGLLVLVVSRAGRGVAPALRNALRRVVRVQEVAPEPEPERLEVSVDLELQPTGRTR